MKVACQGHKKKLKSVRLVGRQGESDRVILQVGGGGGMRKRGGNKQRPKQVV